MVSVKCLGLNCMAVLLGIWCLLRRTWEDVVCLKWTRKRRVVLPKSVFQSAGLRQRPARVIEESKYVELILLYVCLLFLLFSKNFS